MSKLRFTVNWTNFPGSPGYSHYIVGDEAGSLQDQVSTLRTWLSFWASRIPNDVSLSIEPTAQLLDDTTGHQIGASTIDPGAIIIGTDTLSWSASNGVCVIWHTGVYRNNREVRGRTFFVPAASSMFGTDSGAPLAAQVSSVGTAALALATNMPGMLFVETSQTGGSRFVPILGGTLSPRAAVLRSRRD